MPAITYFRNTERNKYLARGENPPAEPISAWHRTIHQVMGPHGKWEEESPSSLNDEIPYYCGEKLFLS